MSKFISQSSLSNFTIIPSATNVAGSHPSSDSLWATGAMVDTVPSSSGYMALSSWWAGALHLHLANSLWSRVVVDRTLGLAVFWIRIYALHAPDDGLPPIKS